MVEKKIVFTEVAPRDGLQNEPEHVPTAVKVELVNALAETGVQEIEVTAFVKPQAIPQLDDAEEVCANTVRKKGVVYSALVPNVHGFERALKCRLQKVALFTSTSDTFNQKNIRASLPESLRRFQPVARMAQREKLSIRGYISTAFHCPYEGPVEPKKTWEVAQKLFDLGCEEIALGDTDGQASPNAVRQLLELFLKKVPVDSLALHFHDTYGLAIANALTAFQEFEVYRFDAAAGGLGGCPFARGAGGNVATEDLAFALEKMGAQVHLDLKKIVQAIACLKPYIRRAPLSRLSLVLQRAPETFGLT